jgi:hypothetical protein
MSPEEKLRLTHIAEAAALIANYINGISKEAFLSDTLRQDAVIRRFGERPWLRASTLGRRPAGALSTECQ